MAANDLNCNELVELITDYLEGAMPVDLRALCDEHLAGCTGCRNYLEQMLLTIQLLSRAIDETVPLDAKQLLLQRFREMTAR